MRLLHLVRHISFLPSHFEATRRVGKSRGKSCVFDPVTGRCQADDSPKNCRRATTRRTWSVLLYILRIYIIPIYAGSVWHSLLWVFLNIPQQPIKGIILVCAMVEPAASVTEAIYLRSHLLTIIQVNDSVGRSLAIMLSALYVHYVLKLS